MNCKFKYEMNSNLGGYIIMKKTIIASSLAVGLGLVAGNAGHDADASELNVNTKAELAQLAQSNDQSLNEKPVQSGAYDFTFNYEGNTYHFASDGTYFEWQYYPSNGAADDTTMNSQAQQGTMSSSQGAATQQSTSAQTAQTEQAPQSESTQQPQTQATSHSQSSSASQASSHSSVNVNSHLKAIAQRESGGDIHAVNPSSGAAGKYQFMQSTWDHVAPSEYKGVSPANAPEHVQDAAAQKLYDTEGAGHWTTA